MKKIGMSLFVLTTVAALSACGGETNETEETEENTEANSGETEPLSIYTTLYTWEYMAKEIGGEHVQVENIVPPGADLHNYEPTSQTMIDIAESDLFIYNGAGIEGFAGAINDTLEAEEVERLEVTNDMNLLSHEEDSHEEEGEEDEHGHEEEGGGDEDPHVWLDPVRTIEGAAVIKDQLVAAMPEQEETFESNFSDLEQQLNELDDSFQTMADEADKNEFIVSHAGYGYWEERYDLHQIGISGLSPSDEPSQRDIQNIVSLSEEENINHIMFEQNIPSGIAEVVQEETGTEALNLHNLEALTEEDIENEEDYFTIMNQNIENLEIALNE